MQLVLWNGTDDVTQGCNRRPGAGSGPPAIFVWPPRYSKLQIFV